MKKILFIIGSLRKNSFSLQLAKEAEITLGGKAEVSYLEYSDIPFMNQDIEFPAPDGVSRVRKSVADADALWFFTPEYNFHIPGLLKNLLDWLSRPLQPNNTSRSSAIKEKTAAITSVAGKSAGAGARKNLSALLTILSVTVVGNTGFSANPEAFQTGSLIITEDMKRAVQTQAEQLLLTLD